MSTPAHLGPAGFFIMFPVTFIITFILALRDKHISLIIPYISDTGDKTPESCVFGMLVSVCAVVLGSSVYVRHLQICQHSSSSARRDREVSLWNNIGTGFGLLSALGLLLVANFQEDNYFPVHYTGAVMCICGGVVYFIFQTVVSYLMRERLTSMYLLYIRVLLTSFSVLFLIVGFVSTVSAIEHSPTAPPSTGNSSTTQISPWTPSNPYWIVHVLSTSSEWSLAAIQSTTILTFVPELRRLKVVFPKLIVSLAYPVVIITILITLTACIGLNGDSRNGK